jgi:hypothetical protein
LIRRLIRYALERALARLQPDKQFRKDVARW